MDLNELFAEEYKESCKAGEEIAPDSTYSTRFSNNWRFADLDSFLNFMEGSAEIYLRIAKKCKQHGITHVYDIGCNCGWQAKIFQKMGITYTGIEVEVASLQIAPRGDGISYISKAYPFPISITDKDHTAAISNLCLGYLLGDKQKEAYEQLAKDFRYFCGSLGPDNMNDFGNLFGMSEPEKYFLFWGDTKGQRDKAVPRKMIEEQKILYNVAPPRKGHGR